MHLMRQSSHNQVCPVPFGHFQCISFSRVSWTQRSMHAWDAGAYFSVDKEEILGLVRLKKLSCLLSSPLIFKQPHIHSSPWSWIITSRTTLFLENGGGGQDSSQTSCFFLCVPCLLLRMSPLVMAQGSPRISKAEFPGSLWSLPVCCPFPLPMLPWCWKKKVLSSVT